MPHNNKRIPKQITISFTAEELRELEEIQKLTGLNTAQILQKSIAKFHKEILSDEEEKQRAKIDSMLDVQ